MRPGPNSTAMPVHEGVIERYREFLPVSDETPHVSMGEGGTPLVRSHAIGPELGCDLYFKLEGSNPTGSFKDRGMVLAVAKALEDGKKTVMCASTGNTSASASAYAARYEMEAIVLVPAGEIALGKLAQAMAYGARVLAVRGNFDDALRLVRRAGEHEDIAIVNSINPYRIEGQKTAAFEIVDDLGDAPDLLCIPVGNAGNITAYWRGFKEYWQAERAPGLPRMMGFQAAGAAPLVHGRPVEVPETVATAIRIGNPASWDGAIEARDDSGGLIDAVTDRQIVDAYLRLARSEGIFCEPASAASVAGLLSLPERGVSLAGKTVVCVVTGNGLKDPSTAEREAHVELEYVEPVFEEVEALLGRRPSRV